MLPTAVRRRIVDAIYSEPELYGCQVGYYGDAMCSVLSDGYTPSVNYMRIVVVVEQTGGLSGVTIDDTQVLAPDPTVVDDVPEFISNESRVESELVGAGLSCGFAVISGIGVLAGAAAEVPSAGTSTALVVVSWIGFATSAVQCVNGVVRSAEALRNPQGHTLQQWDENTIYSTSMLIVDVVGVASAVASLPVATRNLLAVLERRGSMVTAEALSAMSRAERQAAIRAALQQATRTPEGQREVLQALRAAGLTERQAAQTLAHGAGTGRRALQTARAISQVTSRRLNMQLMAALSGGLTPLVSATPSRLTGSASGSVNALIVHVINLAQTSS